MSDFIVIIWNIKQDSVEAHYFDALNEAQDFAEFMVDPDCEISVYRRIAD